MFETQKSKITTRQVPSGTICPPAVVQYMGSGKKQKQKYKGMFETQKSKITTRQDQKVVT